MPLYPPVLAGLPAGGTTGQVLAKQSAGDYDTGWETPSAGGGLPLQMPIADGRYYSAPYFGRSADSVLVDDLSGQVVAIPFICSEAKTWAEIGVECNNSGAGDGARLGIYANNGGKPGALIVDAGEVTFDTTGSKTITISTALAANTYYWLAIEVFISDDTAEISGLNSNNATLQHFIFGRQFSPVSGDITMAYVSKPTYGVLPDPFAADPGDILFTNGGTPFIWLRTGV